MIEKRLILLRKKIKLNRNNVIQTLISDSNAELCFICGSKSNLTKEHVIPKWAFENNSTKAFVTQINGQSQKYSRTVLSACFDCNSYILGSFEKFIEKNLNQINLTDEYFNIETLEKLILWLELIDYKFQFLNLRRVFLKAKDSDYIEYISNIPICMFDDSFKSPSKTFKQIRNSRKRLSIKSKVNKVNSLLTFKSKNKDFHFFHKTDEFIYLELPKQKKALFYFINKEFESNKEAYDEGVEIIKKTY